MTKNGILNSFKLNRLNISGLNSVLTKITYNNQPKSIGNCKIDYFCNPNDILSNFMSLIDEIRKPIANEMQIFKSIFAESLRSDNPLLSSINAISLLTEYFTEWHKHSYHRLS